MLADAEADAPLPLTLVETDGPLVGLVLGTEADGLTGVPPPAVLPVPVVEPDEPALPLLRPLASGALLVAEPLTGVPGALLVIEPPAPAPPVAARAAAC